MMKGRPGNPGEEKRRAQQPLPRRDTLFGFVLRLLRRGIGSRQETTYCSNFVQCRSTTCKIFQIQGRLLAL
jgi:hypothetical protein